MRSPAAAIAWEFRQRHRWGLIAVGVYYLILAAIKLVFVTRGLTLRLDSPRTQNSMVNPGGGSARA